MPTVIVTGRRNGRRVRLEWTDGELTGDPPVATVLARATAAAKVEVGHPGLVRGTASLARGTPPEIVAGTLSAELDSVISVEGLPPPERLPDGAVA